MVAASVEEVIVLAVVVIEVIVGSTVAIVLAAEQ